MAKFKQGIFKILEPVEKKVVIDVLTSYYPGLSLLEKEDQVSIIFTNLDRAIDAFNIAMEGREWRDLTKSERKLWMNNKDLWDSVMDTSTIDVFIPESSVEDEFIEMVDFLRDYILENDLKAMVLGLSGGIDSTLAAAICHQVERQTGVPLIGVSMPLKNKPEETSGADITGKAWCDEGNYYTIPIEGIYEQFQLDLQMFGDGYNSREEKRAGEDAEDTNLRIGKSSKIANGNIAARVRMTLLYHIAGMKKGITISTGNKTENLLGFFTIHGDEPMDYAIFPDLYKTEVYRMVEWILKNKCETRDQKESLEAALKITPTDGNGVSDSDLHQIIGEELAESLNPRDGYYLVDQVLYEHENGGYIDTPEVSAEVKDKILDRVKANKFKQRFINYD